MAAQEGQIGSIDRAALLALPARQTLVALGIFAPTVKLVAATVLYDRAVLPVLLALPHALAAPLSPPAVPASLVAVLPAQVEAQRAQVEFQPALADVPPTLALSRTLGSPTALAVLLTWAEALSHRRQIAR